MDTSLLVKRMKEKKAKIFNSDGTIQETELKVMNLRPTGLNKNADDPEFTVNKQWEEVRMYCLQM